MPYISLALLSAFFLFGARVASELFKSPNDITASILGFVSVGLAIALAVAVVRL